MHTFHGSAVSVIAPFSFAIATEEELIFYHKVVQKDIHIPHKTQIIPIKNGENLADSESSAELSPVISVVMM